MAFTDSHHRKDAQGTRRARLFPPSLSLSDYTDTSFYDAPPDRERDDKALVDTTPKEPSDGEIPIFDYSAVPWNNIELKNLRKPQFPGRKRNWVWKHGLPLDYVDPKPEVQVFLCSFCLKEGNSVTTVEIKANLSRVVEHLRLHDITWDSEASNRPLPGTESRVKHSKTDSLGASQSQVNHISPVYQGNGRKRQSSPSVPGLDKSMKKSLVDQMVGDVRLPYRGSGSPFLNPSGNNDGNNPSQSVTGADLQPQNGIVVTTFSELFSNAMKANKLAVYRPPAETSTPRYARIGKYAEEKTELFELVFGRLHNVGIFGGSHSDHSVLDAEARLESLLKEFICQNSTTMMSLSIWLEMMASLREFRSVTGYSGSPGDGMATWKKYLATMENRTDRFVAVSEVAKLRKWAASMIKQNRFDPACFDEVVCKSFGNLFEDTIDYCKPEQEFRNGPYNQDLLIWFTGEGED